jgi:hypothetical protein
MTMLMLLLLLLLLTPMIFLLLLLLALQAQSDHVDKEAGEQALMLSRMLTMQDPFQGFPFTTMPGLCVFLLFEGLIRSIINSCSVGIVVSRMVRMQDPFQGFPFTTMLGVSLAESVRVVQMRGLVCVLRIREFSQ